MVLPPVMVLEALTCFWGWRKGFSLRIVLALGGNALLQRGQKLQAANQRENVRLAAALIAPLIPGNELVVAHGNGPQVGLQALQAAAYTEVKPYPLDVLCAHTQAQIGYMLEQELWNALDEPRPLATVMTMVQVDPADPAFANPTKPIGPVYGPGEARQVAQQYGWSIAPDGDFWRRVVPSPRPQKIFEQPTIERLLSAGTTVICAGGGGVPCAVEADGHSLRGVEAIIDKDLCSSLLARKLDADVFVIVTDVDGVYADWGQPNQRRLARASVRELSGQYFAKGSMGPKVEAACEFAQATGRPAVIGALRDIDKLVLGEAGTVVVADATEGVV